MKSKVYFSYSNKDKGHIERLREQLAEFGIETYSPEESLAVGDNIEEAIKKQISEAKVVVIFLTENSAGSAYCIKEIKYALAVSEARDKLILPIAQWGKMTLDLLPDEVTFLLKDRQIIFPEDGLHSKADYRLVAEKILDFIEYNNKKESLYRQVVAFRKSEFDEKAAEKLCEIITLLFKQLKREGQDSEAILCEICKCTIELAKRTGLGYGKESREAAHIIYPVAKSLRELNTFYTESDNLFLLAVSIITIKCGLEVESDCIDTFTNGDVHKPQDEGAIKLTDYHHKCAVRFNQITTEFRHEGYIDDYSPAEAEIILRAEDCLNLPFWYPDRRQKLLSDQKKQFHECENGQEKQRLSEEESRLWEIADYIEKSNHIFDLFGVEEGKPHYLRCLKASYERLLKFCEVSGCKHVGATCVERIEVLKQQLNGFDADQVSESMAENAIRALLGLTLIGNDSYDVFISYKHEDADIARSVYSYLTSGLLFPFVDYISLPEIAKSEYEGAIMNALEKSRHFIVIVSSLEYFQADWVKREMETFHHEMVEGRKKGANFIILVTDDVYNEIMSTNKKCIDIKYRMYEIIPISKYKDKIMSYIKSKN